MTTRKIPMINTPSRTGHQAHRYRPTARSTGVSGAQSSMMSSWSTASDACHSRWTSPSVTVSSPTVVERGSSAMVGKWVSTSVRAAGRAITMSVRARVMACSNGLDKPSMSSTDERYSSGVCLLGRVVTPGFLSVLAMSPVRILSAWKYRS